MSTTPEPSFHDIINNAATSEHDAYVYLERLRWPSGDSVCPHCGNDAGNYYLKPKSEDGMSRATRTGRKSQRRVHKCKSCRKQFSAITGTVMHGTKISILTWLMVIYEMCTAKNGISAREVERKYNLTPKTAWHMLHRIRAAMDGPDIDPLVGTVVADETYIGGKERNKHKKDRWQPPEATDGPVAVIPGERQKTRPDPRRGKTVVLTLISEETGEARSRVINEVSGHTLRKVIAEQTRLETTRLVTDEAHAYKAVGKEMLSHDTVVHSKDEYAKTTEDGRYISTNIAEGFFSQLKRSLDGTHHHVSAQHLPLYLGEFDFRYSTRDLTDGQRMRRLIGQTEGVRLLYRPSLQAS